jgi:hypothetical protein
VKWMRRTGDVPAGVSPASPAVAAQGESERVERISPGIAALFDGVGEDRTHAVLDLGPASASSLRLYGRFARWIRFADLLSATGSEAEWRAAVAGVPPQPQRAYDIVLAWNVFDRVAPEERPRLVERLAAITAPDARVHVIVESAAEALRQPLRFTLLDVDRMAYEPTGRPLLPQPPLLPAEVERLLGPFHVTRAFTSRVGFREYVAVRRGR